MFIQQGNIPPTRRELRIAKHQQEQIEAQAAQLREENAVRDTQILARVAEIRQLVGFSVNSRLCTAILPDTGELCRKMTKELSAQCKNCRPRGCCGLSKFECQRNKVDCARCKKLHCIAWSRNSDKDENICVTCIKSPIWSTCIDCNVVFEDETGLDVRCCNCRCEGNCPPGCPKCYS